MRGTGVAHLAAAGFFILLLAGCAAPLHIERVRATAEAFPGPVEHTEVPFFPQEAYQCGPAALATLLNWSGLSVSPEQLTPQVYLPERHGSLQLELIATARRHGRVPYVLRPQLESLLAEVASGHPVLVLQNLGLARLPRWHYAVVVGFDLAREEIVLRSGTDKRRVTPLAVFEHTWRRADYWAMVVMPPDRLPYTAEEIPYLRSVATLERLGHHEEAAQAYAAVLGRWPKSLAARMGLGNTRYALGDLNGAAEAFRRAVRDYPDYAPAHNNLARVLAEQGRLADAEQAARRALALGGPHAAVYRETLDYILGRAAKTATPSPTKPD